MNHSSFYLKKELIEKYEINIFISKINSYYDSNKIFKLSDIIGEQTDYKTNFYKGFILMLVTLNYVDIFSNGGNQQFLFKVKKKI